MAFVAVLGVGARVASLAVVKVTGFTAEAREALGALEASRFALAAIPTVAQPAVVHGGAQRQQGVALGTAPTVQLLQVALLAKVEIAGLASG